MEKHWDERANDYVELPMVDAFLADVVAVYRKHGMSIGHEDPHGSFVVEPLDDENVRWLQVASVNLPT